MGGSQSPRRAHFSVAHAERLLARQILLVAMSQVDALAKAAMPGRSLSPRQARFSAAHAGRLLAQPILLVAMFRVDVLAQVAMMERSQGLPLALSTQVRAPR